MRGSKAARGERVRDRWTTVHSRSVRHPVPALRGRIDALTDHLVPGGRDGTRHWIVIGMMPTNQRAADSEPEPPTEDCCLEIGDMMVASG